MGVFDLYSKRNKTARGETPDVYVYDSFPENLKVQFIHIWDEAIGQTGKHYSFDSSAFSDIQDILRKEYGGFSLASEYTSNPWDEVKEWFLEEQDVDRCLDAVELTCKMIDVVRKNYSGWDPRPKTKPDDALKEINQRFREAGIGYQYESGEIIRVDSQLIHKEAVIPVLNFLNEKEYASANTEFLKAHGHYRKDEYDDCNVECLKAFESTMKIICQKRVWTYNQKDTAKTLIDIIYKNNLIPQHLQSQFSGLRAILEGGIPTIRNKHGGHGKGVAQQSTPDYLASFQLHQTASTILMLIKAEKALP